MLFDRKAMKILRENRGRSFADLGREIGVSAQAVECWESGKNKPRPEKVRKLATALRCDVSDISDLLSELGQPSALETLVLPRVADTIHNTPELRECIKDAMLKQGLRDAMDLKRLMGYDSVHTIERLLQGKLNFFPDMLSCMLDTLNIRHDDAPMTPDERMLLYPDGLYNDGAMLIRPLPVVDWANASSHLASLCSADAPVLRQWDPETTVTVAAPIGTRKGTQAFCVRGESMEPKIQDGDILFVEPRASLEEVPNGKIVVVKFTDCLARPECTVCKRFRRIGETILLSSDNPEGHTYEGVHPEEIAWIGVVVKKVCDL